MVVLSVVSHQQSKGMVGAFLKPQQDR